VAYKLGCYNTEYKINDSTLQYKNNVRDLGVIIDCNLKFEQHISNVVHKAHNRANLIMDARSA